MTTWGSSHAGHGRETGPSCVGVVASLPTAGFLTAGFLTAPHRGEAGAIRGTIKRFFDTLLAHIRKNTVKFSKKRTDGLHPFTPSPTHPIGVYTVLHFLPDFVLGSLALLLMILNTIFWCVPLYAITLLKLIPIPLWRRGCTQALIWIAENWIGTNKAIFRLTQRADWEVQGAENLKYDGWYLVNSNHQSWADIFVLQSVFNRRIPFLKFFLKQELIWMPVIGLAWWALDFPFMKRYSKAYLEKYPEKRGKDLETTRKACEKFQFTPVSVMNFLEGTRFTPAKHARQESPFRHLLRPRAGGIAFVLGAMGERIQSMLDVTIVYPEMIPTFWDFLSGRVSKVIVRVEELKIPTEFFHGDYLNDPQFRQRFQQWVNQLWQQKDGVIDQMKRQVPVETAV